MSRRRPFRLLTERLVIRMLARADVTEFTRYRNLPDVGRYQDWPLPYTRDLAHELVDEMERLDGPVPGRWVQLAVERAGRLVGDVAVWLDDTGTFAMIGYTIAPEHQHHGYASEAVDAVVDRLFESGRVHRVAATLDPRNLASARVLERCGFRYVGTARSAALVRDEWTDDTRYSLYRDEWASWRARPTDPPREVRLVPVTPGNVHAVGRLDRAFSQQPFVATVLESFADALVPPVRDGVPVRPWYRAVEADGELAGFVMLAEPHPRARHPYLWRLLVDVRHQGRGIGRRTVDEIVRLRRAAGDAALLVSYLGDLPGSPEGFYRALGFVPTGDVTDAGAIVARLTLGR